MAFPIARARSMAFPIAAQCGHGVGVTPSGVEQSYPALVTYVRDLALPSHGHVRASANSLGTRGRQVAVA
jgi:hypothetical protein